ncbi:MAG TPA: hypothetical protein VGU23_05270 [Acidobacteriaceae bacterium]|nr:hypothetical protein [Acidobacteriaceae bacterium]
MTRQRSITRILTSHFFRRFFDNDTLQVDGDTQTTIVRAVAAVAAPGMMIAFFLQNRYPGRTMWAAIGDRYFFVLFSFFVLGLVALFEWDMLFPDRLDFLVLTPLSLRPVQMLSAKAAALAGFLILFLFGANIFGVIMLPAVSLGNFHRQVFAQAVAVSMAGVFASLLVLAVGGVLICVLDAARLRMASPIAQTLCTMTLLLMVLHNAMYGGSLQAMLSLPLGAARYVPPLWFLGVYETLLLGHAAPPFAPEMTRYAVRGLATVAALVVLTYPLAWSRRRRMAIEGAGRRRQASRWRARMVHAIIRRPQQRAVFHFIGQTIVRNNRYQVYLAMYAGAGLALAAACAVRLHAASGAVRFSLSASGLHAMLPLLLFWTIAGLRTAFAFPLSLSAAWIFRIAGADTAKCATAARKWVLLFTSGIVGCVVLTLRAVGWSLTPLLVQAVCGVCLSLALTDGFFSLRQSVPFTRPRMPGRINFPLMLTLYFVIFPLFILWIVHLEMQMERHPLKLLIVCLVTAAIHAALAALRRSSNEIEEDMEGYEGEFQLLGLS